MIKIKSLFISNVTISIGSKERLVIKAVETFPTANLAIISETGAIIGKKISN